MAFLDEINSYKAQINNDISTQTDPNSIAPDTVGSIGIDLADIMVPEVSKINKLAITGGSAMPSGGLSDDRYFKANLNEIAIYRNINGIWTFINAIPLGITYPDGILVGLRTSIDGSIVTVSPGTWAMSNISYTKLTQTQLTLAAKDLNFGRWDLIYANNLSQINLITGVASSIPVKPALPANSLLVDYAYVPNIGSPFLLSGTISVSTGGTVQKSEIPVATDNLIINWQTDIVPNDVITYAVRHGNSIANIQGHQEISGIYYSYRPNYSYTKNLDGSINELTITDIFTGTLTII